MYMQFDTETSPSSEGQGLDLLAVSAHVAEVKTKLAHTVRNNAKRHHGLTSGHVVRVLLKDLPRDIKQSLVTEMMGEPLYKDIKSIFTQSGQLFLYSLNFMTPREAEDKGHREEMKQFLAEKIRRDSGVATTLTRLTALYALWPELEPVRVCAILNEMQNQPEYGDVKTVSAGGGELYLYSELHITEKYAALLARSAVNDACETIVHTVREESMIVPRPTKVTTFNCHVFGIPASSLQPCIVRLLNKPEYADIRKLVHPDTEAVYLYSNLYLNEERASAIMKWLEEESTLKSAGDILG